MNNFQSLVLLNMVDNIGSVRIKKLLEVFNEARNIFRATHHELVATGILTPLMARHVLDASRRFSVDREIESAEKNRIRILTIFDQDYPKILKEIYDPPIVLYVKGALIPADANAVALVGSRGASFYGLSCAEQFATKLARFGLTIVSGMARGIDTVSHRAALNAGGRTLAILGSGFNNIYPPENEGLFSQISENGACLTQFPLDTEPLARNFPIRNRIISGLARGVLVVEASAKSGALITARFACEQGREVYALPGKVSSETSLGTNDLIKQGARMVTKPEEILEDLASNFILSPVLPEAENKKCGCALFPRELAIIKILSDEPKHIDLIAQESGLGISDSASILLQMELKGIVTQLSGKTFVRTSLETYYDKRGL
jgi:DNA processing protein